MAQTKPKLAKKTSGGKKSATARPEKPAPQPEESVHGETAEISEKLSAAQQEAATAVGQAIERAAISLTADPDSDAAKAHTTEVAKAIAHEANAIVETAQRAAEEAVARAVQAGRPTPDAE